MPTSTSATSTSIKPRGSRRTRAKQVIRNTDIGVSLFTGKEIRECQKKKVNYKDHTESDEDEDHDDYSEEKNAKKKVQPVKGKKRPGKCQTSGIAVKKQKTKSSPLENHSKSTPVANVAPTDEEPFNIYLFLSDSSSLDSLSDSSSDSELDKYDFSLIGSKTRPCLSTDQKTTETQDKNVSTNTASDMEPENGSTEGSKSSCTNKLNKDENQSSSTEKKTSVFNMDFINVKPGSYSASCFPSPPQIYLENFNPDNFSFTLPTLHMPEYTLDEMSLFFCKEDIDVAHIFCSEDSNVSYELRINCYLQQLCYPKKFSERCGGSF